MKRPQGQLRIIGGQWRSRRIEFDPDGGVRPTPDRVRQTLFDWLAPLINGASCLDLFAGSGALGLEALSRGADRVCFVERGVAQLASLRAATQILDTGARARLVGGDALGFLAQDSERYDVVFVDPPYDAALLPQVLAALPERLKSMHRVYCEWRGASSPEWPPGWTVLKDKRAGQVSYALICYTGQ